MIVPSLAIAGRHERHLQRAWPTRRVLPDRRLRQRRQVLIEVGGEAGRGAAAGRSIGGLSLKPKASDPRDHLAGPMSTPIWAKARVAGHGQDVEQRAAARLATEVAQRPASSGAGCTTSPPGSTGWVGVTMPVCTPTDPVTTLNVEPGKNVSRYMRAAAACRASPRAALDVSRRLTCRGWTTRWGRSWGSSRTRGSRRSSG